MNVAWILLVVVININGDVRGASTSSPRFEYPAVTMQEFSNKDACLFAQTELWRKANEHKNKLRMVCVPKG